MGSDEVTAYTVGELLALSQAEASQLGFIIQQSNVCACFCALVITIE
jgi:hypothetical protein